MRCALFAIMILFVRNSFAQAIPVCGMDLVQSLSGANDSVWKASQDQLTRVFNAAVQRHAKTTTEGSSGIDHIDTIAIAVHVIHNGEAIGTKYNPSDEAIQNAIEYANEEFAGTNLGSETGFDMGVRFVLAKRDPQCRATTGIDRIDGTLLKDYSKGIYISSGDGLDVSELQNFIKWDPQKYLNIWLVNILNDGKFAGVGYFPTDPLYGVIVETQTIGPNKYSPLAHELGHTLTLRHPFDGGDETNCPYNFDCNLDGDGVCDTDPVERPVASQVCRTGINPCTGTDYTSLTEHNIMNYTRCPNLFTADQRSRAKAALAIIPQLQSLVNADSRFPPGENDACFMGLTLKGDLSQHTAGLWWTSDNIRSDYYLERSYDGFHFTTIAVFPFSDGSSVLTFSDHSITQELTSYRLYQKSDSNKIYSNTVILMDSTKTFFPISLLGNPVTNTLDIQIGDIPQKTVYVYSTTLYLRLINLVGQTVFRYSVEVRNAQRLRIPIASILSGGYVLQALINGQQYVFQVLVN